MKIQYKVLMILSALVLYLVPIQAGVVKYIRVGSFQEKIVDSGDQGQSSLGKSTFSFYKYDGFLDNQISFRGFQLGAKDWTTPDGDVVPYKITGAPSGSADEDNIIMPLPDEDGITIHKYVRYTPPNITVDGFRLDPPFPRDGDAVAPEKIPGTADVMVESWARTSMGLTLHQKVLAWSQKNHDDYIIYDWTFTNTGNIDLDDEIELPDQTLNDLYFFRIVNTGPDRRWLSAYGQMPEDTLRLSYQYPYWRRGVDHDNYGNPNLGSGFLRNPEWMGEAVLHADVSATDKSDNFDQPHMTGPQTAEVQFIKYAESGIGTSDEERRKLYQVMEEGFEPFDGTPYIDGRRAGTHHVIPMDEQGYLYPRNLPWYVWLAANHYAVGPYQLEPGDSIRIVFATVMGSISRQQGWDIGRAWLDGSLTWDGDDNLPPPAEDVYADHPDWTEVDKAKDHWVSTGKDSLFRNTANAQWNVQNNYNVPIPPPAPSIEVRSLPDRINISWGNESEEADDFAGYKVYRAIGTPDTTWQLLETFEGNSTHSYDDEDAIRGQAYYYYVSAYDDGSNAPGVNGTSQVLESGEFMNRTTRAAHLTRPPKTISDVRVVPNPYNINSTDFQFTGEPNKIMFMNLPPECTIRIYTESGDLVKTLNHTDGSGDEPWGDLPQEHSATRSSQIITSGIYLAHVETPDGNSTVVKFVVVR